MKQTANQITEWILSLLNFLIFLGESLCSHLQCSVINGFWAYIVFQGSSKGIKYSKYHNPPLSDDSPESLCRFQNNAGSITLGCSGKSLIPKALNALGNCPESGNQPRNWQPTLGMDRNRALLTAGPGCHLQDSRKHSSTDARQFPTARDEAVGCAKLFPLILFSSLTK